MGFRKGAWATVWAVDPKTSGVTTVRISVSHKNKETGQYDQDFSGFVSFIGADNAAKATRLKERDRIRLGETDVETKYDAKTNKTYTNYKCFGFEFEDSGGGTGTNSPLEEDFMKVPEGNEEEGLPFDSPY